MEHPDMLSESAEKTIDCQSQLFLDDTFKWYLYEYKW